MGFIQQFELQKCGSTDKILCPLCILDSGQLYQDTSFSLAADIRFGNAELVDPVSDRLQGLIGSQLFDLFGLLFRDTHDHGQTVVVLVSGNLLQVFKLITEKLFKFLDGFRVSQGNRYPGPFDPIQIHIPDMLFLQKRTNFLGNAFNGAFDGFLGIHFEHEVHAALQVQAEIDFFMRPYRRVERRQRIYESAYYHQKN